MAIRSGMQTLVDRLRVLTNAGTAQYTAGTATYWTDTHLQDVLDGHNAWLVDHPLIWRPQTIATSDVEYLTAVVGYRNWEEAESGTARWVVRDAVGTVIGTATYSTDYRNGRITFTSDQGGTAYYLTGYSYNVYAAAVEVLEHKLAYVDLWYDVSTNHQGFNRSQVMKNLQDLIDKYQEKSGENEPGASGDVRSSMFVRVDIESQR